MRKKILLIIPNARLRQLYHEIMSVSQLSVVSCGSVAQAVGYLIFDKFNVIVLHTDSGHETNIFKNLLKRRQKWSKIKVFEVTDHPETIHRIVKDLQ